MAAAACGDDSIVNPHLELGRDSLVVVSNVSTANAINQSASITNDVAYVSLTPGTVPDGQRATVRNPRNGSTVSVAMADGGFDPIALNATAGDTLVIEVRVPGSNALLSIIHEVPARRRPIIVRIDPAPRKRDVPLNANVIVVFSEPIDANTLTLASMRLLRGSRAIAGKLHVSGTVAVFDPATDLDANADYRLEITDAVRDLDGEHLEAGTAIEFTTGVSLAGEPVSLQLSPDSIAGLVPGTAYDIIPTVRDDAGNVLIGYAPAWASSTPVVATVAAVDSVYLIAGRVTGVAEGSTTITASFGNVSATAHVTVREAPPAGVSSVTITPTTLSLGQYDAGGLHVTLRDAAGRPLGEPDDASHETYLRVGWSVDRPDIIDITKDSMSLEPRSWTAHWNDQGVIALAEGTAMLVATSEGVSDTAFVTVGPPRAMASLRVDPIHWTRRPGETHTLYAEAFDAQGQPITWLHGRPPEIAWSVDNPALASVDEVDCNVYTSWPSQFGPSRYVCRAEVSVLDTGFVTVTAGAGAVSDQATIAMPLLTFTSVTAGGHEDVWYINDYVGHTCGTTVSGMTVCWGGDGGAVGDEWTHFSTVPWGLVGGYRFELVSAGTSRSCGLMAAGEAYCWSSDIYLDRWYDYTEPWTGDTIYGMTDAPRAVPGGHTFVTLDGGVYNTCGVTGFGETYCWESASASPTLVAGAPAFVTLAVGRDHACGLTSAGAAYCWGSNARGQLGDGSGADATSPVAVSGAHTFTAITAGDAHSCAVRSDGAAYCWGRNSRGELGDGSINDRTVPAVVSGGLSFAALSTGGAASTTCGITAAGATYCWGDNRWGQVGDGTTIDRLVPTGVAGGLSMASVSTGDRHTCGVTPGGVAYCWGWNSAGQLGNGTRTSSSVPVRVAGQP